MRAGLYVVLFPEGHLDDQSASTAANEHEHCGVPRQQEGAGAPEGPAKHLVVPDTRNETERDQRKRERQRERQGANRWRRQYRLAPRARGRLPDRRRFAQGGGHQKPREGTGRSDGMIEYIAWSNEHVKDIVLPHGRVR